MDFLPIGSVIEPIEGRPLMIIGYLPNKPNDTELYDYICCKSQRGIMRSTDELVQNQDYYYINNEDIETVKFIGYNEKNFDLYNELLIQTKEEILTLKRTKEKIEPEDLSKLYSKIFDVQKSE